MNKILAFSLSLVALLISYQTVLADGTPPVNPTQAGPLSINSILSGIPWGLVIVFIIAGVIISTIKKNTPENVITVSCCVPFVNEKKMEIEKQKIAEEEAAVGANK